MYNVAEKVGTVLPWMRHQFSIREALPQHLQGLLVHGRIMVLYRSFATINHNANLSIHCWLLELEREYKKRGRLPPTIYHQIDGGSQETNIDILGLIYAYLTNVKLFPFVYTSIVILVMYMPFLKITECT